MTPEQPNEEWWLPEFEEIACLHEHDCGVNQEDECTCTMGGTKNLIRRFMAKSSRHGELKAWEEAKKIVDRHIEHFGDDCVFLIDQEFNSRIQQYGTKE